MSASWSRRGVLRAATGIAGVGLPAVLSAEPGVARVSGARLRLSVNAYSFNQPLRNGEMTLFDLVDYCAKQNIDALDATGYYFPGYPEVPEDAYLYRLKRHAFVNGVTIHGTGVRNDFAVADAEARTRDIQLVKNWVVAASKLGATTVRVFTGRAIPEGYTFDQALDWMVPAFKECTRFAGDHGIILGLQNHHDFAKTAEETIRVIQAVDSPWFRVILDVGSLRLRDVYAETTTLLGYAVSWQLKERVWFGQTEQPIDLRKLKRVIEDAGYRGFFPVETLGAGDPREKVAHFLKQVRAEFGPLVA